MAYVSKVLINWQLVEESFGQLIAVHLTYFPPSNFVLHGILILVTNCSIFDLLGLRLQNMEVSCLEVSWYVCSALSYLVLEISSPLSSRLPKLPVLDSFV